MQDIARGQAQFGTHPTQLSEIVPRLCLLFKGLTIETSSAVYALLPLPEEAVEI